MTNQVHLKVISFDPLTVSFPQGVGPFEGIVGIEMPDMDIKVLDLSFGGMIDGNPGVYGKTGGMIYTVEAARPISADELLKILLVALDNFKALSEKAQQFIEQHTAKGLI